MAQLGRRPLQGDASFDGRADCQVLGMVRRRPPPVLKFGSRDDTRVRGGPGRAISGASAGASCSRATFAVSRLVARG